MLTTTKKIFHPLSNLKVALCASCRLRAELAVKRWSRQRRNSALHAVSAPWALDMLVATRSFSTAAVRNLPRNRRLGSGKQEKEWQMREEEEFGDKLAMALLRGGDGRKGRPGRDEKEREGIVYSDELDAKLAGEIRAAQQLHLLDKEQGSLDRTGSGNGNDRNSPENEEGEENTGHVTHRTHPFTLANRFGTHPTTVQLPASSFVEPAAQILSGTPPVHLSTAAHRLLGGPGLPHSPSTPAIGRTMQQKALPLGPAQVSMREIEADVFLAAVAPGVYSSLLGVLADTRRRLGTAWAEGLVRKAAAGDLRVLDAGGGGAGVLAVREVLRAEWERIHEDGEKSLEMGLAEANGQMGGAGASPPLGHATVLTASVALRKRISQLLEDTTFVPRLPEYRPGVDGQATSKAKFDIIVAPHTLWPLWPDYLRQTHVLNMWDLLRADGGLLVLLEKGVGKGFEAVAAAREMLLERRIATADARAKRVDVEGLKNDYDDTRPEPVGADGTSRRVRAEGMIVGPCTNHAACPMYVPRGNVQGRKDICHFEQRYIRPPFLQKLLGARDRNHEDIKFTYLAVMRGQDLREAPLSSSSSTHGNDVETVQTEAHRHHTQGIHQDQLAADQAFAGYGEKTVEDPPHPLTLPIAILPPLKRRGHVILDVCTPAGALERWTVPRSFGRQAYHDARKARWGDGWALGAKSRVRKTVLGINKHARARAAEEEEGGEEGKGGQMRRWKKVKGVRDKRDKKGVRLMEE